MKRLLAGAWMGSLCLLATLCANGCASPQSIETLTPEQAASRYHAPLKGHFVEAGGAKIFYLDSWNGSAAPPSAQRSHKPDRPPLILIHGLGASTFSFRRNLLELSKGDRVLALDLKGFGFSKEFTNRHFSFDAEADLVIDFMNALGIRRATLVGHSLGGTIAALVAARHPDRVDRLVLIDSATLYVTRPFVTRLLHGKFLSGLEYQLAGPDRNRVRKLLMKAYADPARITSADVEGYYFPFTVKNSAEALRLFLTTNNPNENALLARIKAPTLILWGAEDSFFDPSVKQFLHQQIKHSELRVIPHAGHALPEE